MKRLLTIGKWLFIAWGSISLLSAITAAGVVAYGLGVANRTKVGHASPRDVEFVLNWCDLGDNRIESVIHSYESARGFTGDHLDAYAIRISHVAVEELRGTTNGAIARWYRGDQLPYVLDEAVDFVGWWLGEIDWFPPESELRSSEMYVYPWGIRFRGVRPIAAQLIFLRPSDRMVFYFSGKM